MLLSGKGKLICRKEEFAYERRNFGKFNIEIFDEWVRNDVGQYYVQIFDATLANTVGEQPGSCIYAETCGHASVLEFNGDVYACDHYVFPEFKIGNIKTHTIFEMMFSEKQNYQNTNRRAWLELFMCRFQNVLQAHQALYGVYGQ